jgi:hypothetical protein
MIEKIKIKNNLYLDIYQSDGHDKYGFKEECIFNL